MKFNRLNKILFGLIAFSVLFPVLAFAQDYSVDNPEQIVIEATENTIPQTDNSTINDDQTSDVGSAFSPEDANAAYTKKVEAQEEPTAPNTVFQLLEDGPINDLEGFGKSAATTFIVSLPTTFACGQNFNSEDLLSVQGLSGAEKLEKAQNEGCISEDELDDKPDGALLKSGFASIAANSFAYMSNEVPVPADLAYFINDTFDNTMFGTPAFAQGEPLAQEVFQITTFTLWKIVRNFCLAFLTVMVGLAGFAVIFRQKLSPQVNVTLMSVLPNIPIAILLIALSYAIVAFALKLSGPLTVLGVNFVDTFRDKVIEQAGLTTPDPGVSLVMVAINVLFFVGVAWIVSFAGVIIGLILLACILGALIYVIWTYIKIFINLWVYTVVGPIIGLLSILPGNQRLAMNWIKKVFIEVLIIPGLIFVTTLGFTLIYLGGMMAISGQLNDSSYNFGVQVIAGLITQLFALVLGIYVIAKVGMVRKFLEGLLHVDQGLLSFGEPQRR